jgi:hypothetical protein
MPWHAKRPPGASGRANEVGHGGSCRAGSAQVPGWLEVLPFPLGGPLVCNLVQQAHELAAVGRRELLELERQGFELLYGGVLDPVGEECPGGRPVAAVVGADALRMPESKGEFSGSALAGSPLTRAVVVGRDGIEPPTLRFSAARSTD